MPTYNILATATSSVSSFYPPYSMDSALDEINIRQPAADSDTVTADTFEFTADMDDAPHWLETGDQVIYLNGGGTNTSITELTDGGIYWAIKVNDYRVKLATSYENALDEIAIDLSTSGTGFGHQLIHRGDGATETLIQAPGYYENSFPVLGDRCYLQDSKYYQVYSYVTALEETFDKYASILRSVLHPSGTRHFSEYTILDEVTAAPTLTLEIDT